MHWLDLGMLFMLTMIKLTHYQNTLYYLRNDTWIKTRSATTTDIWDCVSDCVFERVDARISSFHTVQDIMKYEALHT
jgi:hypothetical protein